MKPKTQLYRWFFTIPMVKCSASQLSQDLKGFCKEFYFQGEAGNKTGYEHWQGCLSLKNKEYFQTVVNLLPHGSHIERCQDWFAAKNYSNKNETRICGPYDHNSTFLKILDPYKFYPWQKETAVYLNNVNNIDDRSILWIWDKLGNVGKTSFAKYLVIEKKATYLTNGKSADIAFSLPEAPKIVIFDLSRSNESHINYGAMEAVKNGMVFSSKYESKMKLFDPPHVVVFANFPPEVGKLSKDRWIIRQIIKLPNGELLFTKNNNIHCRLE